MVEASSFLQETKKRIVIIDKKTRVFDWVRMILLLGVQFSK